MTTGALWTPLRGVVYRSLWGAQLASNMAIWMHTVSAQWVLTASGRSGTVVAAVQTAITLPFFLLALPAGMVADAFERRRVLVATQSIVALISLTLAVMAATGRIGLGPLIAGTLVIGASSALSIVSYQSLIPEMVGRPLVPAAATLDGMSFNAGRIVGPALGGVLLAMVSAHWIFLVNAVVFAAVAVSFGRWSPVRAERPEREPIGAALRQGLTFVRHDRPMRRLLLRLFLWTLPASLVWALLPLIAHDVLGLGSRGFGGLFAALGVGAVAGGMLLQPVRARLTPNALIVGASVAYGGALLAVASVRWIPVVALALAIAGAAWITVLSTTMALAQVWLPNRIRARGLAVVLLVHQGCQAFGSLLWGVVADLVGVPRALTVAGMLLLLAGLSVRWIGLRPMEPAVS